MSYRFEYVKYDEESQKKSEAVKQAFVQLETLLVSSLEDGRARQLALTNLEQSFMWTGKSIRDSQIKRVNAPAVPV